MNMVTVVDSGSSDSGRRRAKGSTARTGAHDDKFKLRAGLGQRRSEDSCQGLFVWLIDEPEVSLLQTY